MKRIGSSLLKTALLFALFAASPLMMPTQSSSVTQEAHAALRPGQIRYYLEMEGYEILDLYQLPNSENWESHTILNGVPYLTTVVVKGDQIIDHEDSSI